MISCNFITVHLYCTFFAPPLHFSWPSLHVKSVKFHHFHGIHSISTNSIWFPRWFKFTMTQRFHQWIVVSPKGASTCVPILKYRHLIERKIHKKGNLLIFYKISRIHTHKLRYTLILRKKLWLTILHNYQINYHGFQTCFTTLTEKELQVRFR